MMYKRYRMIELLAVTKLGCKIQDRQYSLPLAGRASAYKGYACMHFVATVA